MILQNEGLHANPKVVTSAADTNDPAVGTTANCCTIS